MYGKQAWRKGEIGVQMKHSYEQIEFKHSSLLSKPEGKQFSYSVQTMPGYHEHSVEKKKMLVPLLY
jgi:hypothetical protein